MLQGPAAIDCPAIHTHVTNFSSHVALLISLHPMIFKMNFSLGNKASSNSLLGKKKKANHKTEKETSKPDTCITLEDSNKEKQTVKPNQINPGGSSNVALTEI